MVKSIDGSFAFSIDSSLHFLKEPFMTTKSRLLYVWTRQYKRLNNVGFCLVADYDIEFNGHEFKFKYINDFPEVFNSLKNICTFVGENGVGKSSALELIDEVLAKNFSSNYLSIFENIDEDGVITIELVPTFENLLKNEAHSLKPAIQKLEENVVNEIYRINHQTEMKFKFNSSHNGKDLDDRGTGLIIYNSSYSKEVYNSFTKQGVRTSNRTVLTSNLLQHIKYYKTVKTLKNINAINKIFMNSDIQICNKEVKISYFSIDNTIHSDLSDWFSSLHKNVNDRYIDKDVHDKFSLPSEDEFRNKLFNIHVEEKVRSATLSIYYEVFKQAFYKEDELDYQHDFVVLALYQIGLIDLDTACTLAHLSIPLSLLDGDNNQIFESKKSDILELNNIFGHIKSLFVDYQSRLVIVNKTDDLKFSNDQVQFIFSVNEDSRNEINSIELKFKHKLFALGALCSSFKIKIDKIFVSKWVGVSSGELNLLTLFSGLIDLDSSRSRTRGANNYILLLDEPEQAFHPEWQRKFIYMMSTFLESHEDYQNKNIQIIMTTHSPLTLTDLLEKNTYYFSIKNNKLDIQNKNAFAANIHELLLDKFFLKSTIGLVAENYIKDTVKFLNGDGQQNQGLINSWNDAKSVIDQVSDRLLKNELLKIYSKKYKPAVSNEFVDMLRGNKHNLLRLLQDDDLEGVADIIGNRDV